MTSWSRLDDDYPDHPKVLAAGPVAELVNIRAWCYVTRYLTDGFVPNTALPALVRGLSRLTLDRRRLETSDVADMCVTSGLWERVDGGYRIHNYLARNPSRSKVLADRKANTDRVNRWREQRRGNTITPTPSNVTSNGDATPLQREDVTPLVTPPTERGTSTSVEGVLSRLGSGVSPNGEPRPDILAVCVAMADSEERKGHARPTITENWKHSAKLMIDRDHRTVEQIVMVIRWVENDSFWWRNVRAIPKLRDQFERLLDDMKQPARMSRAADVDNRVHELLRRGDAMDRAAQPQLGIGEET